MSEAEGPWEEVVAVKKWLRETRDAAGMTQAELGARMGLTSRAVLNAESLKEPGLPRGLPFLRMLRALGVVVDAPLAADPLEVRLQSLEAKLETQGRATTAALKGLAKEVRAQAQPQEQRVPQAKKAEAQ